MKHNIINLGQFRIFPRIIDILLELLPYLLIKKSKQRLQNILLPPVIPNIFLNK